MIVFSSQDPNLSVKTFQIRSHSGFSCGNSGQELACQCRLDVTDAVLIPGLGRSPEGGHGNPLQYSCLENPMDREAWQVTVHRIAQSDMTEVTEHTCKVTFTDSWD